MTLTAVEREARLRYTYSQCGGKWKERADAESCHGIGVCTRDADCPATTHYANCKSMPSTQSYTLKEIEALARQWSNESWSNDPALAVEEDLSIGLTLSNFLAWLARREREGRG